MAAGSGLTWPFWLRWCCCCAASGLLRLVCGCRPGQQWAWSTSPPVSVWCRRCSSSSTTLSGMIIHECLAHSKKVELSSWVLLSVAIVLRCWCPDPLARNFGLRA